MTAFYRFTFLLLSVSSLSTAPLSAGEKFEITDEARAYWAFQPVTRPNLPGIDAIIDATLQRENLVPNGAASREQLIRRAYFDLIGLAPTIKEIGEFVDDPVPTSVVFANLVDELLAMPEYGERWGRHWLDVVRYAQTNGYERDDEKPNAWRYRDYVIDSFNADKPYTRFIREQLAGDELPGGGDAGLIATGFYRLGVWDDEPDDTRAAEFDGLDDMVRTTTETFMGLTAGCARCHHHMFDPISQNDYYELLAFFRNVRTYDKPSDKTKDVVLRPVQGGEALCVSEHGAKARETHLLIRGDAGQVAEKVEPRLLEIFGNETPDITPTARSTGRRLALANWIADPANPLTARVMVNRIWQYHFGRGIVATPNDLGKAGHPVSNIALLDWLADEFVKNGWSVKHMHRVIMGTRAYQRSSAPAAANGEIDPGNIHHWRANLRRLEAEALRDKILQVSGALNRKRGGPSFFPALSGEVVAGASRPGRGWLWSPEDEHNRRSVYAFVKRTMVYPFFEIFDYANTEGSLGSRPSTTVAPQALLLLNSEFVAENSARLGERLASDSDPVGGAYRAVLGRLPSEDERAIADGFFTKQLQLQHRLSSQIEFRPDYSRALFKGYRSVLPSHRFLRGPGEGWDYFKGKWGGEYEGIVNVDQDFPPFALLKPVSENMRLSGKIQLEANAERALILLRAKPQGDGFEGYAVVFDADPASTSIRRYRDGKYETLVDDDVALEPGGEFVDFAVSVVGEDILVEIDGANVGSASIGVSDIGLSQLRGAGRIGVIAQGDAVRFRDLVIGGELRVADIDFDRSRFGESNGLASIKGWSAFGGTWMLGGEGDTIRVVKESGPKLLWDAVGEVVDGSSFEAEVRIAEGNIAGLIMNVRDPAVGADNWIGYEISLYLNEKKLVVGTHEHNWRPLASAPAPVEAGKLHRLRAQVEDGRIKVYLDGRAKPYIDFEVDRPLAPGLVGLRTWGATVEYRNVKLVSDGRELVFKPEKPVAQNASQIVYEDGASRVKRRALAELCSMLMNLNEFIYVD